MAEPYQKLATAVASNYVPMITNYSMICTYTRGSGLALLPCLALGVVVALFYVFKLTEGSGKFSSK